MTTTHRTRISFLDGREAVIRVGWLSPHRLLKQYGPQAVVEHGHWYQAVGEPAAAFHPK